MLLFDEDACGAEAGEASPGSGEPIVTVDTALSDGDAIASARRLRRLEELPTSLPVGGIITPV
ncbi:MAG TPA: hypothetical protein VGG42_17140 [Acidobacteriaceae bacterium]|jgi:hypothetical protein